MRVAGLIHCADCHRDRFNTMRRRNQIPFTGEGDGWQNFTLADAFVLRMMLMLMDQNGLDAEGARYIADNAINPGALALHPLNLPLGEGDTWAGATLFRVPSAEGDFEFLAHFAGPLADLPSSAVPPVGEPNAEAVRVVAVNASAAAAFVRQRAMDLGLPEGRDFSPVWPR